MYELIQIAFINVFAKFLKFAFEIGTSFFLNKENYGQFALLISYILIYIKILNFGIPNIIVREIPKYKNKNMISYVMYNSFLFITIISLFSYLLIGYINFDKLSWNINILFISYTSALVILYSTYLRSIQKVKEWILFQDIIWYLVYFLILGVLYITNSTSDITLIVEIYAFSIFSALVFLLIYLRFKYKIIMYSKVSYKKIKYIVSHSFPVLFTGLTYLIISRIDIIMLAEFVDLEIVGEYNIIARITLQVLFFNQVIISYYYPRLSKLFAEKTPYDQISVYNTKFVLMSFLSTLFVSLILFCLVIFFNLFEILNIINNEKLFSVLIILLLTQIIYSSISFYGNILIYIYRQKIEYINNFFILLIAIILNFLLIPEYGVIGAAIGTSVSLLVGNTLQLVQVKYYTGTFFLTKRSFGGNNV